MLLSYQTFIELRERYFPQEEQNYKSALFDWLIWFGQIAVTDEFCLPHLAIKKNLSEAWKLCRILRLQSLVNAIIFGTMLTRLSTFYVPKAGRRATFGSGRNLVKFWRHSALSGLGNCTPCIFILYIYIGPWDLKRKSNHSGQCIK